MNRRGQDRTGALGGSGMVGLWGANSLIASIQYGSLNCGASASVGTTTITAVDTTRSVLIIGGQYRNFTYGNEVRVTMARLELTNSTTVTGTTGGNPSGTNVYTTFCVVEFQPGVVRSVQRGTINIPAASGSATATVTAVTINRSLLLNNETSYGGTAATFSDAGGSGDIKNWSAYLELSNTTTITAARPGTLGSPTCSYSLVEFF